MRTFDSLTAAVVDLCTQYITIEKCHLLIFCLFLSYKNTNFFKHTKEEILFTKVVKTRTTEVGFKMKELV